MLSYGNIPFVLESTHKCGWRCKRKQGNKHDPKDPWGLDTTTPPWQISCKLDLVRQRGEMVGKLLFWQITVRVFWGWRFPQKIFHIWADTYSWQDYCASCHVRKLLEYCREAAGGWESRHSCSLPKHTCQHLPTLSTTGHFEKGDEDWQRFARCTSGPLTKLISLDTNEVVSRVLALPIWGVAALIGGTPLVCPWPLSFPAEGPAQVIGPNTTSLSPEIPSCAKKDSAVVVVDGRQWRQVGGIAGSFDHGTSSFAFVAPTGGSATAFISRHLWFLRSVLHKSTRRNHKS